MEYVYASLLLQYAKKQVNEDNLRKVLLATGISVDENRLKEAVELFKKVNMEELNKQQPKEEGFRNQDQQKTKKSKSIIVDEDDEDEQKIKGKTQIVKEQTGKEDEVKTKKKDQPKPTKKRGSLIIDDDTD